MMKYIEWEDRICELISDQLVIPRSDAQGVLEANDTLLFKQWQDKRSLQEAAQEIIDSTAILES